MSWTVYRQADGRYAIWSSVVDGLVAIDATAGEVVQEFAERELKRLRPEVAAALEIADALPPAQEAKLAGLRGECQAKEAEAAAQAPPPRLSQERERERVADHLDAVANLALAELPAPEVLQRAARAVRLGYFALALDDTSPGALEILEAMGGPLDTETKE